MRRIYLTTISYQKTLMKKRYNPVNFDSNYQKKQPDAMIYFPIIPIISDTMEPGDSAKIVVVLPENTATLSNYEKFQEEYKQIRFPEETTAEIQEIRIPMMQERCILNGLLVNLIEQMEDHACYYADITYGTKTYPIVFFTALRYAEEIREDTEISGIYYQEIDWTKADPDNARLYDETSLFSLDSVMNIMADAPEEKRTELIHMLLGIGRKN